MKTLTEKEIENIKLKELRYNPTSNHLIELILVGHPINFDKRLQTKINWNETTFQKAIESIIIEFLNYADWYSISLYCDLSKSFLVKFHDNIKWRYIGYNPNISKCIKEKYKDIINQDLLIYRLKKK